MLSDEVKKSLICKLLHGNAQSPSSLHLNSPVGEGLRFFCFKPVTQEVQLFCGVQGIFSVLPFMLPKPCLLIVRQGAFGSSHSELRK